MRIYYDVTEWRSLASYAVQGERLFLFNDPYCPNDVGEYQWRRIDGSLELTVVADPCSFGLRGQNLSRSLWYTCQPPQGEVTAASSWAMPPGCQDEAVARPTVIAATGAQVVTVHPGDVRAYDRPPSLQVIANTEDVTAPPGVTIAFGPDSLGYGLNRILWQAEEWIEATIEAEGVTAVGVQFHGDYIMGWARLLLDGREVWRGDTAAIWSRLGQHAGYVEVSHVTPGRHILRVERLPVNSRPVRVLLFGFDEQGVAGPPPGVVSRPNSGG
jgi:hypothetical protein